MGYDLGVDYSMPSFGPQNAGGAGKAAMGAGSGAVAGGSVGGPVGAAIGALVGLAGGLFGAAAEREKQKREALLAGASGQLQSNTKSADTYANGSQGAFEIGRAHV